MSHISETHAVPFGALTVHRIVTAVSSVAAAFRRWNQTRQTIAQLRRLSDRQLEDIGLTRADVEKMTDGIF
jgi:uncharacterized protein YjiS (DUF1127 family)